MRALHMLIVTTTVIAAGSAAAAAGVTAAAGQTVPTPLTLKLNPGRVPCGHPVSVTGRAPAGDAGKAVALQSASRTGASWRQVATARIGPRGGYRFRIVPRTPAVLRAVEGPAARADLATDARAVPRG